MTFFRTFALRITLLFLISCGESKTQTEANTSNADSAIVSVEKEIGTFSAPPAMNEAPMDSKEIEPKETQPTPHSVTKKKIIKDGTITLASEDIGKSKKNIDELAKQFQAYYDNETMDNTESEIGYNLKIRIPSDNFEKLVEKLESGGDVIENKSLTSRDVTAEYVDLETRLEQKRLYLKRYKELLAKANNVKEILAVEESIRNLQEEIESQVGSLKLLSDQISYSSLEIIIYKRKALIFKPEEGFSYSERFKIAFSESWELTISMLIQLISILPIILLIMLSVFTFRRIRKKRRNNRLSQTE